MIVEKWQSPEQWPNLYWLPLPEVDSHVQGGLVLLPACVNDTSQTNTLQANTPANARIFWCITPLSKTGKRATLHPKQQNRAFCLPSSPEQIGKSCMGLLLNGLFWSTKSRHFVFTILILNRTHITVSSMKPFQVVIAHIRCHILCHFFTRSVMHF